MTGFERLNEQMEDQNDIALKQTVEYLISRKDMEQKYLKKEKSISQMAKFIREKGLKHYHNGWNYIPDKVVFAWAVMYFALPNEFLKITKVETKNENAKSNTTKKNNVISLENAKQKIEQKKEIEQISLFGGAI